MIISKQDFLTRAQLDRETLDVWISVESVASKEGVTEPVFSEADLARARLIQDLIQDLGVIRKAPYGDQVSGLDAFGDLGSRRAEGRL